MSPERIRLQNSSPPAVTVALLFPPRRRLLTERSTAPFKTDSVEKAVLTFTIRATKITATLKSIEGYSHGGLNE